MAKAKVNRKRSEVHVSKKKKPSHTTRRQEILGTLILLFGLLLAVSCITYSPSDNLIVNEKSFLELFFPFDSERISNAVGPVGAWIASLVVHSFFGYPSILLTFILLFLGYKIFRKHPLGSLWVPTVHIVWVTGFVATLIGRLQLSQLNLDLDRWSGYYGDAAAYWLFSILGWFGSWLMLGLLFIVGLLLIINRDIQSWFDRVEQSWKSTIKSIKEERENPTEFPPDLELQTSWEDLEPEADPPVIQPKDNVKINPPRSKTDTPVVSTEQEPPLEAETKNLKLKVTGQITEETAKKSRSRSSKIDGGYKYKFPHFDLLDTPKQKEQEIDYNELEENKTKLVEKLARYNIEIIGVNATVGPTVTLYELTPAPGVKVSRIKSLEDDLAMVMAAQGIRMIVPIPGKSAVGVEIPNSRRELVRVQSVLNTARFQESNMELPVVLGKTIEGEVFMEDLAKMPHLLIAGATGSGKSVGLNTLITGLLYACIPSNLKFVMVDPKKIELQQYRELREHFLAMPEDGDEAIITEVGDALDILRACEREMSIRYDLLKDAGVRGITDYNLRILEGGLSAEDGHVHLPYIVIIIDELADLMMTAGKDVEAPIARLAQMARAVGIHLILATQRPSVDVITGLIKANFPARVAFQVASKVDSRTILDQNGAEQLVGNGDMLYMKGSKILRLQGPFVSVDEIDRLMANIRQQVGEGPYRLPKIETESESASSDLSSDNATTDELYEEAARIIVRNQQGSVSLIQRKLSIGYTRAARIVDQLEQAGVVGPFSGAKAREVLIDEVSLEKLFQK